MVLTCIRHLLPSFLDATDRRASLGYEYLSSNAIPHTKAIGVARVVIQAINIGESLLKSRPFVRFRVQSCDENRGTMPESRTQSPHCLSEENDILIYSLHENLEFNVLNDHRICKPSSLGNAIFPLSVLENDPRKVGEEISITKGSVAKGSLLFNIFYYPIIPLADEKSALSRAGLVTMHLHEAKGFGWETYSQQAKALAVSISLGWNDTPIYQTAPSYFVDPAFWGSSFEFFCVDKTATCIVAKLVDHDVARRPVVFGHVFMSLQDMLAAQNEGREWWPLTGSRVGQLRMTLEWRSVEMSPVS